jgi:hypothetical protein
LKDLEQTYCLENILERLINILDAAQVPNPPAMGIEFELVTEEDTIRAKALYQEHHPIKEGSDVIKSEESNSSKKIPVHLLSENTRKTIEFFDAALEVREREKNNHFKVILFFTYK